jgi:hypothetical protein
VRRWQRGEAEEELLFEWIPVKSNIVTKGILSDGSSGTIRRDDVIENGGMASGTLGTAFESVGSVTRERALDISGVRKQWRVDREHQRKAIIISVVGLKAVKYSLCHVLERSAINIRCACY